MENALLVLQQSFNYGEDIAAINRRSYIDVQRHDRSRFRRFHFVLHFHGFNDHDAGARFHRCALRHEHAHNFPGHGRDDPRRTVRRRTCSRGATKPFRISQRDGVLVGADKNINGLPRHRLPFDAAINYLTVSRQQRQARRRRVSFKFVFAAIDCSKDLSGFASNLDVNFDSLDDRAEFHFEVFIREFANAVRRPACFHLLCDSS